MRTTFRSIATTFLLACSSVSSSLSADQVALVSVADNTLIEDPAGEYSCGAAQYFFAGRVGVNGGGYLRRGALRFNLSSIPAGATINAVSLKMYCSAAGLTSSYPVALKKFLLSWGEGTSVAFGGGGADATVGDVTWNLRFYPGQPWPTPGGAFSTVTSATKNISGIAFYTWTTTPAMVADVQGWLNNSATNFGWCVVGNETTMQSAKRFDSRESTAVSARPLLTVTYTPAPPVNPNDLTGDGRVDGADLSVLLNAWGTAGPGDLDNNSMVNGADLSILLNAWG